MIRFVIGLTMMMAAMVSVEVFGLTLVAGAITGVLGLSLTWWPLLDGTFDE